MQDGLLRIANMLPNDKTVPLTQCNTNDSPWLICKTCAAVGRCAQACGTKPLSLDFIDRNIGPDEGDREAVIEIVRQVEAAHGIAASPEKKP
jgi:sugar phosphate isomerase/epimerase